MIRCQAGLHQRTAHSYKQAQLVQHDSIVVLCLRSGQGPICVFACLRSSASQRHSTGSTLPEEPVLKVFLPSAGKRSLKTFPDFATAKWDDIGQYLSRKSQLAAAVFTSPAELIRLGVTL